MMTRLLVLLPLLAFALPCFAGVTHYPPPSPSQVNQIKKWWKPEKREKPDEEFGIGHVYPVRLKSGEAAYVASVDFPMRGRCCSAGILLVRPDLQEARQIDPHSIPAPNFVELVDLGGGFVKGLVMSGAFTGQGHTSGSWALLYFDEWQPVTIFSRKFEDNLGEDCGRTRFSGRPCHSKEVKWVFLDLDGDRIKDLVETIVNCDGDEPDQMTCKTTVNAYLIKDLQLVPAPPGLMQTNSWESEEQAKSDTEEPPEMQNLRSQSSAPQKNESVDGEAVIGKLRSGLDQAVTTTRDILSQFGLTSDEPK
jgi:hypothetical protein